MRKIWSDLDMNTESLQLNSQLQERKRNLQVIEDVIRQDESRSHRLFEVREFLANRIRTIEHELASKGN